MTARSEVEEKISRLNRLYSILSKVNEAIVRIREPEDLYQEVCRIGVEDGGFVMAWVGFVDHVTKNVKPAAFCGMEADYLSTIRISVEDIPEGRGPTGKSIREGKYNICTDFEGDPRMGPWRARGLERGYQSSASFPLKVAGEFEGALTLYAREKNYFDSEEIDLLLKMAEDLSFAIEFNEQEKQRRHAESELAKYREHLEELVIERTAQLEKINFQLRAKNAELEEFAYKVSHELKNNLTAIGRLLEMSRDNASFIIERSCLIKESSDKLMDFVSKTLELARAGKSISEKTSITMEDFITGIFNRLKPPDVEAEIFIQKHFPSIFADRDALEQVFSNLIANSLKYRDPDKKKLSVDITYECRAKSIVISFRDNGSGIDQGILPRVFDVAFTANSRDGHGFGLAIVRKIAEAHGGSICVESEGPCRGAVFIITLPHEQE